MEDDDGHSGVHLARTLTDLLFEPYFLHWRDYAAVERSVDARCILDSDWLDAPKTDFQKIRMLESVLEGDDWRVGPLVVVCTAQ